MIVHVLEVTYSLAKQFWYVLFFLVPRVVASRFLLVLFVCLETVTKKHLRESAQYTKSYLQVRLFCTSEALKTVGASLIGFSEPSRCK